jgi:glutaminase
VLSVMSTCGMYDYSGGWIFNVGMPAKSGVGGGIMAVLPGQLGLGVFSPPLDEKGNSFRGIEACKRLSSDFSLHLFHVARSTSASVIRHVYNCCRGMSRRSRNAAELAVLAAQGQRIRGYELQGELSFGGTESVTLDMLSALPELDFLVLDFKRVTAADQASILVIAELCRRVVAEGKRIFLTDCRQLYRLTKHLRKEFPDAQTPDCLHFEDADHAVEWCENQLLADASLPSDTAGPGADLSQQYLCAGMGSAELDTLRALGTERRFLEGTHVFRQGDPAASMYFILEGDVEVWVDTDTSHHLRLTTLGAGMVFGEVALATQRGRTANVTAVADTRCLEVRFEDLNDPMRTRMLMSMVGYFAGKIEQDTLLIRHLA